MNDYVEGQESGDEKECSSTKFCFAFNQSIIHSFIRNGVHSSRIPSSFTVDRWDLNLEDRKDVGVDTPKGDEDLFSTTHSVSRSSEEFGRFLIEFGRGDHERVRSVCSCFKFFCNSSAFSPPSRLIVVRLILRDSLSPFSFLRLSAPGMLLFVDLSRKKKKKGA